MKPMDDRQIANRAILQQLFPYVGTQTLDILMASINAEVTPPLSVTATQTASLVINVGPAIVSNPENGRQKSLTFIGSVIPTFTGGTVTFPSASGGNITTSTGGSTLLTLPSSEYCQVLLSMDTSGDLIAEVGTPAASAALAVVPVPISNTLPFAYVTLFNNGGTINNVSQDTIFQLAGGGGGSGGSGGGEANEVALTVGTITQDVTLATPQLSSNYIVIAQIVNAVDANPMYIPVTITNKTETDFTVEWNAPLPTSNYFLDYIVSGVSEQMGEMPLNNGDTSSTISLPIPLISTNYVVTAELANYADANPQFQPITVTQKTDSTFTVQWNAPVNSSNYRIAWQVAAYQ